ncbi:hypothetical protein F8388_025442 [Cannabis sativa]|uniref:Sugar phosphate transporter domain-containing protein n=1 Tax=Cannabis sativa TaxID=3483 RepID=A0A7J6G0P3_CANSA|nr:hypothetical protein F8388_025442 [Cannabis sativa]
MDINLSNASLVSISVTFATMCKSGAPIFLLLFAFAFRLESPSIKLSGIILVISLGILLTVAKETEFELGGFILVMLAAVMSGFRWCMTQILLQVCFVCLIKLIFKITCRFKESYGLKNPLTLMSYVTPVMAVATGILSLMLDPWNEFRKNDYFNNPWHVTRSSLLMLLGGTLAFFMVLTEYILVSVTSAVTVTIAGVVKEAVTILVAVIYFGDEFTWLKGAGLFTIMIGVSLFNWYKYNNLQKHHHTSEDMESSTTNVAAKYVILEEMDEQENGRMIMVFANKQKFRYSNLHVDEDLQEAVLSVGSLPLCLDLSVCHEFLFSRSGSGAQLLVLSFRSFVVVEGWTCVLPQRDVLPCPVYSDLKWETEYALFSSKVPITHLLAIACFELSHWLLPFVRERHFEAVICLL